MTLWPIELSEVRYFPTTGALANIQLENLRGVRAGIRFRLRCTSAAFDETSLDSLPIYLPGNGDVPKQLYEQLLGNCCGVIVRPKGGTRAWQERLPASSVRRYGFEDDQALLPYTRRSFAGYRLLQEYFAFPKRFYFFELADLGPAVKRCSSTELEIIVLLDRSLGFLENTVDAEEFALYCTPAINLFPKRADRITINRGVSEFHVLPDRTRPMDFEVHSVLRIDGYGGGNEVSQHFRPFYTARDPAREKDQLAYFTTTREPRRLSSRQRREGSRSSYVGSEIYLSIVDANEAPYAPDLKQLEIFTLCTNRDLPLQMTLGTGATDFSLDVGAPVTSIRCIDKVTTPRPSPAQRENAWQLLSHLSLNYLSLIQEQDEDGARMLRDMLSLYADDNDAVLRKLIEGLRSVSSAPVVRRLPTPGPITFARGLEISVTCDETAFEGTGVFLFGAVMEEFVARYVSLNSFTEMVLLTHERGEVMRWPARIGRRHRV
jgi:type VI secretion system protein ImpG